jgi:hypothetical protein
MRAHALSPKRTLFTRVQIRNPFDNICFNFEQINVLFYSPALADRFNRLFTGFIARAANVLEGFLANNQELINESSGNWYNDANALASLLASINL